jgi:hypothetical protein
LKSTFLLKIEPQVSQAFAAFCLMEVCKCKLQH